MTVVRVGVAGLLLAHGIAHLPGVAVAWRLLSSPDVPYHTVLLGGRVDIGDTGMRLMGLCWLACGAAFVVAAAAWWWQWPSASLVIAASAAASLLLCALEYRDAWIGLILNVVLLAAAPGLAGWLWSRETDRLIERIATAPAGVVSDRADTGVAVPPIVARYLARSLPTADTNCRTVSLVQDAEFFLGGRWYQAPARQFISAAPVGYVWDARIAVAPLVNVFVRDSYEGGAGTMHARVLGAYPVTYQSGIAELNAGALHRYLAEAVWNPSALRPTGTVSWTPIDDTAARVTLVDGANAVSLDFRFSTDGDVVEVFTPRRFAEHNGRYELKPWRVRCSDYATFGGVRIPSRCDVAWVEPSGPVSYWRGRVTAYTSGD